MTVDTKELVATVAYMIGVKKYLGEQYFDEECHDTLQMLYEDKSATIIRYLCKLRTSLMLWFKKTDDQMRYNLMNLDRLEWFDWENIKQLRRFGIEVIQANYRSEAYMQDFCRLILEHIDDCSHLFHDWVNWSYVRDLFCPPGYCKKGVMRTEFEKYMSNIAYYPFQMYIYWKPHDNGNILYTDGKFLKILYSQHGESFNDRSKYTDAHQETKNSIYDFVSASKRVIIAVDCENSDVYKLYAVLHNLDPEQMEKIEAIFLYDDCHTTCGWDWLYQFTRIPVEHVEVERVTNRKSLVDIKMTAEVTKSYYVGGVDSFILVSSDSDYWGLITSLPDARFLVMYEYEKCGEDIKRALEEHEIYYCAIDDFCSGNVEEFKRVILLDVLKKYLPDIAYLNGYELVDHIYEEARITASAGEREAFFQRYIKTLTLKCNGDGSFEIVLKR